MLENASSINISFLGICLMVFLLAIFFLCRAWCFSDAWKTKKKD